VWLKPLKFLGMIYDGKRNLLASETRKGKKLIYDKEKMLEELNRRDGMERIAGRTRVVYNKDSKEFKYTEKRSFEELCRSRFSGFVQNRLYNGS